MTNAKRAIATMSSLVGHELGIGILLVENYRKPLYVRVITVVWRTRG